MTFVEEYGNLTVKQARKLNKKMIRKENMKNINFEKVFVYGISLGIGVSVLYLLLTLTAFITA